MPQTNARMCRRHAGRGGSATVRHNRCCGLIRRRRQQQAKEWEVAKKNNDALLAQLNSFGKMARDLERVRSLRCFMDEIAASKAAPAGLVGNLASMALMADWIDRCQRRRGYGCRCNPLNAFYRFFHSCNARGASHALHAKGQVHMVVHSSG